MVDLRAQAVEVLRRNDRGTWTRPAPELYPHQWSWDAAFIAMGWARIDPGRALEELMHLFAGQWSTGMVPHIVFDTSVPAGAYEPGPAIWASSGHSPVGTVTSSICQPPVHAISLRRVVDVAGIDHRAVRSVLGDLVRALDRWHRWLRTERDPDGSGLVTILHPWESGMDNSPRWDPALDALTRPPAPPFVRFPCGSAPSTVQEHRGNAQGRGVRPDLGHVADPAQRPTDADYDAYRYLLANLVALDHDQAAAMRTHPFRVRDIWFSAILAAADDALADLHDALGDRTGATACRLDAATTRRALADRFDVRLGRCTDLDVTSGRTLSADTVAGLAPLVAAASRRPGRSTASAPPSRAHEQPDHADQPESADRITDVLVTRLRSEHSAGNPAFTHPLPPSTAPDDPAFEPRRYWRGPQWPPITWLLWDGLTRSGRHAEAERLRRAGLHQLRSTGCCEYVDPLTGDALGSDSQSWTAAVALDWLAADGPPGSGS